MWLQVYKDDFDNNAVEIDVDLGTGAGSVTEPPGTELNIITPASDSRWAPTWRKAPIASKDLADVLTDVAVPMKVSCSLTGFVATRHSQNFGICLWSGGFDRTAIEVRSGAPWQVRNECYFDGIIYDGPNVTYAAIPPVVPHIMEIYWVPAAYGSAYNFTDQGGITVNAGYQKFYYSDDDGASFALVGETLGRADLFVPTKFGLYSSSKYNATTVKYDWLKLEADIIPVPGAIKNPSFEIAGVGPGVAADWELAASNGGEQIAPFEGSMIPYEPFEVAWGGGNQHTKEAFEDDDMDACEFNDATAVIEEFMWAWKLPIAYRRVALLNTGRPAPIYANPNDALDLEVLYRDLITGGTAVARKRVSTSDIELYQVDWLNNMLSKYKGFAKDDAFGGDDGLGHIIAELHKDFALLGTGTGTTRQFSATIASTPIHPKITGKEPTFVITVTIATVVYTVNDDGVSNLVCTSDILNPALPNTVDYETGDVALGFRDSPDADIDIPVTYEYGDTKLTAIADNASNLPYIGNAYDMLAKDYELPPYNHSSVKVFNKDNLKEVEIDGSVGPETFETTWMDNENSISIFASTDLSVGTFNSATLDYEGFESDWATSFGGNQTSLSAFTPSDIEAATFDGTTGEPFEDARWPTKLQF
jgi:hypothetical protein